MAQNSKIGTLVFFISLLSSFTLFSQIDSTKTINNEMGVTISTNQLKANPSTTKTKPNINFNINKKINTEAINQNLKKYSNNNASNMLLENRPEDKDIIGVKYWKGKDVTHKSLASTYGLGTVTTTSRIVKIETRDHSYIDGDRIKIYLNEQVISDNVGLKGSYFVIYVKLKDGYNRIDFQALNQGFSGPNTAEFSLYDANGNLLSDKEWNLTTGQTATLGVIKQ
ncbi:hypothetical protein [Lutibacter sp.]